MQRINSILLAVMLAVLPASLCRAEAGAMATNATAAGLSQGNTNQVSAVAAEESGKEEGLSTAANDIFDIGSFHVTNSMLVTWIVAIGVIVFAQVATRNM